MIYENIEELIGNTPLLHFGAIERKYGLCASLYAKAECFNPGGSIKDRAAREMIEAAEARGDLTPGATIIEPTSGNTGIGLAYIGRLRGYKVMIVMPSGMSEERKKLMRCYGAELVLTDNSLGMKGAIEEAIRLSKTIPGSFIPMQFDNGDNTEAHYKSTAPEIYRELDGKVDALVAGVGTGGTVSGIGRYLKEKNPKVKIVAVEPAESPVLSGGSASPHKLQGIGAGFVPTILDKEILDEVIPVDWKDAYFLAKDVCLLTGLGVGISSGAALYAALKIGKREEMRGKNIVVILPDGVGRYLSSDLID
jgi:cysteine synthase A